MMKHTPPFETWIFTRKNLHKDDSWVRKYPKDIQLINQYAGKVIYIELSNGTRVDEGETILRTNKGEFLAFKQMFRKEA